MNIGLIGVGYLGMRHLKHLCNLNGINVAGIWDIDSTALSEAASEYNVFSTKSLDELIELSDAVVVVTPTSTHYEIGSQVIEAGRALFVEKPICESVSEGERLVDCAQTLDIPIQVGHIERFNRAFRALNQVQVKPRFIEAHRLAQWTPRGIDVSVIYDLMIHDLDLILALTKAHPIDIRANGVGVLTDSVDIATARIEFSDGMVANVTASRISLKKMRKLRLFGENEYVAVDLDKGSCEYVSATKKESETIPPDAQLLGLIKVKNRQRGFFRRFLDAPEGDTLRFELASFRDAIANGSTPHVSGVEGLKALKLAEKINSIIVQ